ncbi:MAG: hypothetical protein M1833_004521 [Piccolia ochrophora]|nr:MAG: hypothetical protein M1833_004521 [Piccolia ochrophora]
MTKAKKDEEARAHIAAQGTHSAADQGDGAGGTGAASHFSIGGFDNEIDEDDPSWGPDEENASGRSPLSTPSSPSSSSPSPSPTSSEEDEDEDEEEDDDLALPPRRSSDSHTNSGHTAGSTGSGKRRRPSETTAAVTRTAIDDDDEDEDDEEEDEDEVRAEEVRELLGEIEMEVGGRARGSSRGEVVGKAKSGTG